MQLSFLQAYHTAKTFSKVKKWFACYDFCGKFWGKFEHRENIWMAILKWVTVLGAYQPNFCKTEDYILVIYIIISTQMLTL